MTEPFPPLGREQTSEFMPWLGALLLQVCANAGMPACQFASWPWSRQRKYKAPCFVPERTVRWSSRALVGLAKTDPSIASMSVIIEVDWFCESLA